MNELRVNDALQTAAGRCKALASEVEASSPPALGSSGQPSSTAVQVGHAAVQAAAAALSARMQATGTELSQSWTDYRENEASASSELRVV